MASEHPTLKNIQAIVELEKKETSKIHALKKIASSIAQFSGTVAFILVHIILFSSWMIFNSLFLKFDPYPFTFLTMAVSLESIFLSTFVMISQNALTVQTERRHKLDLQINLLAEQENTALLRIIGKIARHLGLDAESLKEIEAYIDDVDPKVLIDRIEHCETETLSVT